MTSNWFIRNYEHFENGKNFKNTIKEKNFQFILIGKKRKVLENYDR